ncbi:hypothetical protein [Terrisporobacter mayombei]|uniref:Peptidase S74 domain-containing protein n=1 Tax=Terrisporobacter mayombei TaxID=1541 RepID=A0ABY9PX12_9FIRM|nr:hypothetical protein [Terrisporobacter mayombei]MCC3870294.1 hypothetical protein [Terrisporobacter mayombei]WMT79919.1 hypothetical protein TEMA_01900 [Terrisporobacter mayombei]
MTTLEDKQTEYKSSKAQLVSIIGSIVATGELTEEQKEQIDSLTNIYNTKKSEVQKDIEETKESYNGSKFDYLQNQIYNLKSSIINNDDNIQFSVSGTVDNEESITQITLNLDGITQRVGGLEKTNNVVDMKNQYYLSTSKFELVGGTWKDTLPTPQEQEGKFLWIKTISIRTDETTTETSPICISAQDGLNGVNGVTYYTWIKYANDASGTGLSDSPTGKTYIGFAYNKTTATESTIASDYTWSLIQGAKGDTGVAGAKGTDGITYYTWIKYSDNANGNPCYDIPTSTTKYIGISPNQTTATESSDYTKYTWSKFQGDQGVKGDTGATGQQGVSVTSVILQYAKNTNTTTAPTTGWDTVMPTYAEGYYLWIRTGVKYSNATDYVYSVPVCDQSWKANAEVYSQYKQLKNQFNWIVKEGTNASDMKLTAEMLKLVTDNVIIEAKKIELNGSININDGTFRVATNGNTKIGGLCDHNNSDGTSRGVFEVTSNGNAYFRNKTNGEIYTYIEDGRIKVKNKNDIITFDDGITSSNVLCLRAAKNEGSSPGTGGKIILSCNGGDDTTLDLRSLIYYKDSNGNYILSHRSSGSNTGVWLGSPSYMMNVVYAINGVKTSSDRTFKENIVYVSNEFKNKCLEFISNDYALTEYNYLEDNKTKLSAVAQDLIANEDGSNNEIGQLIVDCEEAFENQASLTMNQTQLLNIVIGAFQEHVRVTNDEINELKARLDKYESIA